VNHSYLASIVKESDITRILTYKDDYNSFSMHERERPMMHDNNAFKNRSKSAKKYANVYSNKNILNVKTTTSDKKLDLKAIFNTTVTMPFHHKNFSEIPD